MAPTGQVLENHQVNSLNPIRDNYVGEKRNHLRDGYGIYKYENKYFKYEGQWKAGKKHGHGKLLMKDGSFYEGEFKDGEITGHGFKYWSSSRNTYSGEFYMGELEGSGVMRYSDGSLYEGQWKNNKREGSGKLTEPDGSYYEGEFHNNKRHGEGRNCSSDGSEYTGGYISGKRHGHGVYKMADGSVFDGQWSNDIFNGEGIMMHSSGFTYEGLWINGKPAQLATKIEIVGVDASIGLTISQGQSFELQLQMVDDDGDVIKDNGRELKVSAGYKYVPKAPSKDSSNLFDTIEDVEENLIQTPLGYTILPYPITDQPIDLTLYSENTDLTTITRTDTVLEEEVVAPANVEVQQSETTNVEEQARQETVTSPQPTDEEVSLSHQPPQTQRVSDGVCTFSSLVILPPPPLYRPFQQISDKSSADGKGKTAAKKQPAAKPPGSSDSKVSVKGSAGKIETEPICRTGTYVLMVEDVTDPPFLGELLPTLYTLATVKRKKREAVVAKEKAPKWDTSKHIAATVAMHREDTFQRESTQFSDT